jgi:hypothetical protein
VQDSPWGRDFLTTKYGIATDEVVPDETAVIPFSRWLSSEKPQHRAGHPVLSTKAFPVHKVPWRHVWRTGFGIDYLKLFPKGYMQEYGGRNVEDFKMIQLNEWQTSLEEGIGSFSVKGEEVYAQRLSVYLQRNMSGAGLADDEWEDGGLGIGGMGSAREASVMANGSGDAGGFMSMRRERKASTCTLGGITPRETKYYDANTAKRSSLDETNIGAPYHEPEGQPSLPSSNTTLDNLTTLIIFETSHSGLVTDCLLEPRTDCERRWRRLFTELPREVFEPDSELGLLCIDIAVNAMLNSLVLSWERLLTKCDEHVSILEDRIYENPADESRAPELWTNSSVWLKIEKLQSTQSAVFARFSSSMREISLDEREWFAVPAEQMKRVGMLVDEDLVRPTKNLSDMMYKSVDIRDSKHSLDLGTSMWRLSWITFIFLPLTFLTGFFGMNVDTFQRAEGYPHVYWYFVAAVPLMLIMFVGYGVLKEILMAKDDPQRRGMYESANIKFAHDKPGLWTKFGPRPNVQPKGRLAKLQYRLIQYWFKAPRKGEYVYKTFGRPMSTHGSMPHTKLSGSRHMNGGSSDDGFAAPKKEWGYFKVIQHALATRWLASMSVEEREDDDLGAAENGKAPNTCVQSAPVPSHSIEMGQQGGIGIGTGQSSSVHPPRVPEVRIQTPSTFQQSRPATVYDPPSSQSSRVIFNFTSDSFRREFSRHSSTSGGPSEAMVEEEDPLDFDPRSVSIPTSSDKREDNGAAIPIATDSPPSGASYLGVTVGNGYSNGQGQTTMTSAATSAVSVANLNQSSRQGEASTAQDPGPSQQRASGIPRVASTVLTGVRAQYESRGWLDPLQRIRSETKLSGEAPSPSLQRSQRLLEVPVIRRNVWSTG